MSLVQAAASSFTENSVKREFCMVREVEVRAVRLVRCACERSSAVSRESRFNLFTKSGAERVNHPARVVVNVRSSDRHDYPLGMTFVSSAQPGAALKSAFCAIQSFGFDCSFIAAARHA